MHGRAGAGDQGHASGVVTAQDAEAFLAVAGGDRDRLVAADQAGRGLHDGLQKIVGRAHGTDAGEFGTHVAALVSESVALDAGGFGRVEDGLTAADIPGGQLGADLFEALPATGQSGVERLEEAVALGADFGGIALEGGSQRFRADGGAGLGLAQSGQ